MNTHRLDHSPFLVSPDKRIQLGDYDRRFTADFENKAQAKAALSEDVSLLAKAQEVLWASGEYAVLIIFQAMDAAGKDSAIKHVMSGVNPQGCEVRSFKAPNEEELAHHFLWRPARAVPARGRIGIFNRSYYEEVLVVRVHPELLELQRSPRRYRGKNLMKVWEARYEEINVFERMLTQNDVCIIKFFLHVSREEQRKRFLERLSNPQKHWKFSAADIRERTHWNRYMDAYEDMLNATSTESAPWYVVPADKKWFTRACVADIITSRIGELNLKYPEPSDEQRRTLQSSRQQLEAEA